MRKVAERGQGIRHPSRPNSQRQEEERSKASTLMRASGKTARRRRMQTTKVDLVVVRPIIPERHACATAECVTGGLETRIHARSVAGRCALGVGVRMSRGVMCALFGTRLIEEQAAVARTRMSLHTAVLVVEGTHLLWLAVESDARGQSPTRQKRSLCRLSHTVLIPSGAFMTRHALACCATTRSARWPMASVHDAGREPTGVRARRPSRKSEEVT